ncbi:MAG: undecaprenyl diphosphate synthase [Halothiobacillaceae bacterium]|nr:MAG: undecaprenyl diphosphate synthase [Halothiobacillaceae bacterium]
MSNPPTTPPSSDTPRHIAIIMDGNGRWARKRLLPRIAGHKAGVDSVRTAVQECARRGVEVLTLFAFSSENWRRPPQEVSFLMELFLTALERELRSLHQNNVRVRVLGDTAAFAEKLQHKIRETEQLTQHNSGLTLNVAANYGGRWDIAQAVRRIAQEVAAGRCTPEEITEASIEAYTQLHGLPEPDLFIRTGGEQRISNFMLWHLAYTELYFTDLSWPDFDAAALEAAIASFRARERRFGRTSEQVQSGA